MKNKKRYSKIARPPVSVEILARSEMLVSGCTGIIHLTGDTIGIRAGKTSVWVKGEDLTISWAGSGRLLIRGVIDSLEYKGDK